jgi:hypothetical protein
MSAGRGAVIKLARGSSSADASHVSKHEIQMVTVDYSTDNLDSKCCKLRAPQAHVIKSSPCWSTPIHTDTTCTFLCHRGTDSSMTYDYHLSVTRTVTTQDGAAISGRSSTTIEPHPVAFPHMPPLDYYSRYLTGTFDTTSPLILTFRVALTLHLSQAVGPHSK